MALRFYSGPQHRERAQQDLDRVARETGRSDVRIRARENGSVIVAGHYDGPGDASALAELERLKGLMINGTTPYATTYLAPPMSQGASRGNLPQYNLATAKERFGEDRAVYTLEYASFDEGSKSAYQQAAEEEVVRLRGQGELAFYYHGRFSSSVTLGLFGEDAKDDRDRFSAEVDFLQRRFKFLMRNGERIQSGEGTFWPTRLVRVPG